MKLHWLHVVLLCAPTALWGQESPLASGQWVRVSVQRHGVHTISGADWVAMGLPASPSSADLTVLGLPGGPLPQTIGADSWPQQGIVPLPLLVEDGGDGVFDTNDKLHVYLEGPDGLLFDGSSVKNDRNLFSRENHYFVGLGAVASPRLGTLALPDGTPEPAAGWLYRTYETELQNLVKGGRLWVGEDLRSTNTFTLESLDVPLGGGASRLHVDVASAMLSSSVLTVEWAGLTVGDMALSPVSTRRYSDRARPAEETFELVNSLVASSTNTVRLQVAAGEGTAYLNHLVAETSHELVASNFTAGQVVHVVLPEEQTLAISGVAPTTRLWRVTSAAAPEQVTLYGTGSLRRATLPAGRQRLVFQQADGPVPTVVGPQPNQNLLALASPNLLILSHADFMPAAERLAAHRRAHDGLAVAVVDVQQVYTTFGGGKPSPTALRDFIRYLYERGSLEHVLVVGKGTFDPMGYLPTQANYVPIYQSRESYDPIFNFGSDDYLALLEPGEGEWQESQGNDDDLDIGVGRFPVTTLAEAEAVVDKIMAYETEPASAGAWRNRVLFVADDGDNNVHQEHADLLAQQVEQGFADFGTRRLFLDAYEQTNTASGEFSVALSQELRRQIDQGSLVVNYTGHGSPTTWCQENIFSSASLPLLDNRHRLPLFLTATCEFGRHDDAQLISAGESLLTLPERGAIGLITTARPVFSSTNFDLNSLFYDKVFQRQADGEYMRLGDIFREVKNEALADVINRNFSLLADPSMRLAYPEDRVVLDQVNGQPAGPGGVPLQALRPMLLEGHVQDGMGQPLTEFTGTVRVEVWGQPRQFATLGNEGDPTFFFDERVDVLFRGQASVTDGQWMAEFVVPKNIDYLEGTARVSLYAQQDQAQGDANGGRNDLPIGGTFDPALGTDNQGPQLQLWMGDTTWVEGGAVPSSTLVVARLADESGLNLSQLNVGQGLLLLVDDTVTYQVGSFFESDLDDFRSGWLAFPLNGLAPGEHTATLLASDTHNNAAEVTISFFVGQPGQGVIERAQFYPNPVGADGSSLWVRHNMAGKDVAVQLSLFNAQGHQIGTFEREYEAAPADLRDLRWAGDNGAGAKLSPGVYYYRVSVRSQADGTAAQHFGRVVLAF